MHGVHGEVLDSRLQHPGIYLQYCSGSPQVCESDSTNGTPSGLPASLSTTLSPGVLSLRRIFASLGIWCVTAGNLPISQLARKNGHKTALLSPTSNWTMYSRMCSAKRLPQSQLPKNPTYSLTYSRTKRTKEEVISNSHPCCII